MEDQKLDNLFQHNPTLATAQAERIEQLENSQTMMMKNMEQLQCHCTSFCDESYHRGGE